MTRNSSWRWVFALWALATLCTLFLRPVTPIDETRYLTVAWEMRLAGEPWMATLNGEPYSHKPPLLFWLINAGWMLSGVGDVWPRFLTAALGLAAAFLTARCAAILCADRPGIGGRAALALTAIVPWLLYNGAVMFDVLLTVCTLAAIVLVLGMQGAGSAGRWAAAGAALGLGLLAKGPAALLQVLPLALLAPLWKGPLEPGVQVDWWRWYRGVLIALAVGLGVLAVWLLPAVARGGDAFLDELIWKQTIDRMATTTHHLRPVWFYIAAAPVLLFPLWLFPAAWRGLRGLAQRRTALLRVAACWILPVATAFSLFRGKQLHYLYPLLPAFAVLAAAASTAAPRGHRRMLLPAAAVTAAVIAVLYAVITLRLAEAYDVAPMARRIAALQDEGAAVANVGRYHGQFQFVGRLTRPLAVLRSAEDWRAFRDRHPQGYVVVYAPRGDASGAEAVRAGAAFAQRYRSRSMSLWRVDGLGGTSFGDLQSGDIRPSGAPDRRPRSP